MCKHFILGHGFSQIHADLKTIILFKKLHQRASALICVQSEESCRRNAEIGIFNFPRG